MTRSDYILIRSNSITSPLIDVDTVVDNAAWFVDRVLSILPTVRVVFEFPRDADIVDPARRLRSRLHHVGLRTESLARIPRNVIPKSVPVRNLWWVSLNPRSDIRVDRHLVPGAEVIRPIRVPLGQTVDFESLLSEVLTERARA